MHRRPSGAPLLLLAALISIAAVPLEVRPPAEESSTRFAVLGDAGTGDDEQYELAEVLVRSREVFPFDFAILLGDNLYGRERPEDYREKFEVPYRPLLDAGVRFYASLGNHDDTNQRFYELFNMDGNRYYSFKKGPARFFVLDSNYMDRDQLDWFERELSQSGDRWKIAYFHHPLYSSGGRHGSELDLREMLEPLMIEHGVDVVFAGHEHFYERIKPQHGIYYFISGAAGKLRRGDIERTDLTAAGFDEDRSFMLVEITGDAMRFQSISRAGRRVDGGVLPRPADAKVPNTTAHR